MPETKKRYYVQCQSGHVSLAPKGSELEQKCIEHEKAGFIDALGISFEECFECQQECDRQDQMTAEALGDDSGYIGCPDCGGNGQIPFSVEYNTCNGTGKVWSWDGINPAV